MARPEVRRDVEIGRDLGLGLGELEERLSTADLALLRAEWHTRNGICQEHGGPLEDCTHEEWFPQRSICRPAMERAAAEWKYDAVHEELPFHDGSFLRWSKERSEHFPFHARDGVTLWVAREDVNPDDDFLSPVKPYRGEDI